MQRFKFVYIFPTLLSLVVACADHQLYVIKPTQNQDMAIDGIDPTAVKLQEYKAIPSQLWSLEEGNRVGLFYIINNGTGKALDYHSAREGRLPLNTKDKRTSLHQQWAFRLNGRITNAENRRVIDVDLAIYTPGNFLALLGNSGNAAQEFVLEKFQFSDLLIHDS